MKKTETAMDDNLRSEYDLKNLQVRKVGPKRKNSRGRSTRLKSEALNSFQKECQDIHVCYNVVYLGLQQGSKFIEDLVEKYAVPLSEPYRVGTGTPHQESFPRSLPIREVLDLSAPDGDFPNQVAKWMIVVIYSLWEDRYRGEIAKELNVSDKNKVEADLMGDIRQIRNCIVYKNSVISDECSSLKKLKKKPNWDLCPGPLCITYDMFVSLMESMNQMEIQILGTVK